MATAAAKAAAHYCAKLHCDPIRLLTEGRVVLDEKFAMHPPGAGGKFDYSNWSSHNYSSNFSMNPVEEGVQYGSPVQGDNNSLDLRGWVAVAELPLYVPVLVVTVVLMTSAAERISRRQWKWIYLNLLSLIRVAGAAILIVAEECRADPLLFAGTYALINAGVSPLVIASSEVLATIASPFMDEIPNGKHFFRGILALTVPGIVLAAVGGIDSSEPGTSSIVSGNILRKISAFSLLGAFLILVQLHILLWVVYRRRLEENRKYLLGLSSSIPFLLVRVIYQILSSFSQNLFDTSPNPDIQASAAMAPFNAITGSVPVYIAMALVPELVVVATLIWAGTRTTEESAPYVEVETEDDMEENEERTWRSHLLAGTAKADLLRRSGTTASERPAR